MKRPASLGRRRFLQAAGACAAASLLPGVLWARSGGDARFVVIILRGALDGLAAVPPYADADYAALRRDLGMAAPGAAGGALDLDGHFGLHPALGFLHERFRAGELTVVHAVSSPYRDRSHFDGQAVLENGLTQALGSADGWLNRALPFMPAGAGAQRALALSQNVPLILRGGQPVMTKSPQLTPEADEDLLARLADLYSLDDWFSARLSEAVQSERLQEPQEPAMTGVQSAGNRAGENRRRAPNARLQQSARLAAAVMAADGGPEIAVLEASGWDTHANQGAAQGTLAGRLAGLDESLQSLAQGLGSRWRTTVVTVITEFGRTAAMNGTRGTDHGTGTCCFVVGGGIAGGRVISDWPGLSPRDLYQGRDLLPTTDLRSVLKAILGDHLKVPAASLEKAVFPDSSRARPLTGLLKT